MHYPVMTEQQVAARWKVSLCAAICATVFSPRIASSATLALNAGDKFRLGFLMNLVPPVDYPVSQNPPYTRVLNSETTSTSQATVRCPAASDNGAVLQRWPRASCEAVKP